MLIINLGTNDFGHDSGPTWEAGFSKTYTEFVLNATQLHYKDPKMPVFVAQGKQAKKEAKTICFNTFEHITYSLATRMQYAVPPSHEKKKKKKKTAYVLQQTLCDASRHQQRGLTMPCSLAGG